MKTLAAGFGGVEPALWQIMATMVRPGAALLVAPAFAARAVPRQIRIAMAAGIALAVLARNGGVGMTAGSEPLGWTTIAFVVGEALAGIALGFVVQIGVAAAMLGGEVLAQAMGLGFAASVDPSSGHHSPVLSSAFAMLATVLFLATDGHHVLIQIIAASYDAWPPGTGLRGDIAWRIVLFGGHAFAAGVVIALPVAALIWATQIAMAMLARAAPNLNLFAVGFPAALTAGLFALALLLPVLAGTLDQSVAEALGTAASLLDDPR